MAKPFIIGLTFPSSAHRTMRISELTYLLDRLDLQSYELKRSPGPHGKQLLRNLPKVRELVAILKATGAFSSLIEPLQQRRIESLLVEEIIVDEEDADDWQSESYALLGSLSALKEVLKNLFPSKREFVVHVSVPTPHTLELMGQAMQIVDEIFKRHLSHEAIQGKYEVHRWEAGSFWIEMDVGTREAVCFLGALSRSAKAAMDKFRECELIEAAVIDARIVFEGYRDIQEAYSALIVKLIDREAKQIAKHYLMDESSRTVMDLTTSIKQLYELMRRGGDIQPGPTVSEDVMEHYPESSRIALALLRNAVPPQSISKLLHEEAVAAEQQ